MLCTRTDARQGAPSHQSKSLDHGCRAYSLAQRSGHVDDGVDGAVGEVQGHRGDRPGRPKLRAWGGGRHVTQRGAADEDAEVMGGTPG